MSFHCIEIWVMPLNTQNARNYSKHSKDISHYSSYWVCEERRGDKIVNTNEEYIKIDLEKMKQL